MTPGAAANTAEDSKQHKFAAPNGRFSFEPVALKTAGVFGKITEVLL